MNEHTPLPWSLCNDGKCSCLTISCPDHPIAKVEAGEWGDEYPAMRQVGATLDNRYEAYMERIGYGSIDPEIARANAQFIVKAVNNHDALVAKLAKVVNWLGRLATAAEKSAKNCSYESMREGYIADAKNYRATIADILPALEAAQGGGDVGGSS